LQSAALSTRLCLEWNSSYLSIAKTIRHNKYILIARTNENKIKCFSPFRSTLNHWKIHYHKCSYGNEYFNFYFITISRIKVEIEISYRDYTCIFGIILSHSISRRICCILSKLGSSDC